MEQKYIRNFSIIAHVDHGKSTLADRLLETTNTIHKRDMQAQLLDTMDLERERGITIKMTAVRLSYIAKSGQEYQFNLIDTPGHVDFTYEVSRSLAACEGALLIVDAAQGVEAQTLANVNLAYQNNLALIPVINKIDLPAADPERVREEIESVLALDASEAVLASAKAGIGIDDILEAIVKKIPPPSGNPEAPLRALIFDSKFDNYLGVVCYVRVVDGQIRVGTRMRLLATGKEFEVTEVGTFAPERRVGKEIRTGEVGYVAASIKTIGDANVGDTLTDAHHPTTEALPGYRQAKPMVFCGLYPVEGAAEYSELREALSKLQLNDAALSFEPETSAALGHGFRCGFLGLLHMEIVQERLEREFGLFLIATSPSVIYKITKTDNKLIEVDNPADMPSPMYITTMEEPYVVATLMLPTHYAGAIMELCRERRGNMTKMEHPAPDRMMLTYEIPLSEILLDFFDQLKSRTKGYASFDYELSDYKVSSLVKIDVLINGEVVDALSFITHRDKAQSRGRLLVERLREVVPRQQYEVRLQAAIGGKIIAAESIKPFRKNVIAKCYGGDITRKRKLLEKQKEGKKRMKQVGSVEIPQEAFLSVLKIGE